MTFSAIKSLIFNYRLKHSAILRETYFLLKFGFVKIKRNQLQGDLESDSIINVILLLEYILY